MPVVLRVAVKMQTERRSRSVDNRASSDVAGKWRRGRTFDHSEDRSSVVARRQDIADIVDAQSINVDTKQSVYSA